MRDKWALRAGHRVPQSAMRARGAGAAGMGRARSGTPAARCTAVRLALLGDCRANSGDSRATPPEAGGVVSRLQPWVCMLFYLQQCYDSIDQACECWPMEVLRARTAW